jgi:hypothetical protein
MKTLITLALFGTLLAATGCTQPGQYPVSGQECGPGDPVQDLDINDCTVPGVS